MDPSLLQLILDEFNRRFDVFEARLDRSFSQLMRVPRDAAVDRRVGALKQRDVREGCVPALSSTETTAHSPPTVEAASAAVREQRVAANATKLQQHARGHTSSSRNDVSGAVSAAVPAPPRSPATGALTGAARRSPSPSQATPHSDLRILFPRPPYSPPPPPHAPVTHPSSRFDVTPISQQQKHHQYHHYTQQQPPPHPHPHRPPQPLEIHHPSPKVHHSTRGNKALAYLQRGSYARALRLMQDALALHGELALNSIVMAHFHAMLVFDAAFDSVAALTARCVNPTIRDFSDAFLELADTDRARHHRATPSWKEMDLPPVQAHHLDPTIDALPTPDVTKEHARPGARPLFEVLSLHADIFCNICTGLELLSHMSMGDHQYQPWPPSDELRLMSCDAGLRPLPWPSFNMVESCSIRCYCGRLWKPPWPIQIRQQISISRLFPITERLGLLATGILDRAQLWIQYGSKRPSRVVAMILGIDDEKETPQLFTCDPAGYFFGHKAASAGQRDREAVKFLERKIKNNPSLLFQETVQMAILAVQFTLKDDLKATEVEAVRTGDPTFRVLTEAEISEHLKTINPGKAGLKTLLHGTLTSVQIVCDGAQLRPTPWLSFSTVHEAAARWCFCVLHLSWLLSAWSNSGYQCEVFVVNSALAVLTFYRIEAHIAQFCPWSWAYQGKQCFFISMMALTLTLSSWQPSELWITFHLCITDYSLHATEFSLLGAVP